MKNEQTLYLMAAKADPGSYEIIVNIDILNTKII
jgi:hypothetical protein